MVRNPSELQRLEEEREELIKAIIEYDGRLTPIIKTYGVGDKSIKAGKEAMLRKLREIEGNLDIEGAPYNSTEFGEQLK